MLDPRGPAYRWSSAYVEVLEPQEVDLLASFGEELVARYGKPSLVDQFRVAQSTHEPRHLRTDHRRSACASFGEVEALAGLDLVAEPGGSSPPGAQRRRQDHVVRTLATLVRPGR